MATVAPHALYGMYAIMKPHLPSMRIGGVVGDVNHGSGYHISREDNIRRGHRGDYSIQAPADKRGPSNAAAAIDITLSASMMVTVSKRLKAAFDRDDDRIDVCREFIGTVDNRNVCGWNRYRTGRRTGWYSSGYSDSSHLWHVHISFFRAYVNDTNAVRGVAEVVCGLKPGALGWKGDNNEGDDELPSVKDVWTADIVPAPDYAKSAKNPNWQPQSHLIEACQQAHRALEAATDARDGVKAVTAKVDAQTKLIADLVALVSKLSQPAPAPAAKSASPGDGNCKEA